jgi:hypothetical protein
MELVTWDRTSQEQLSVWTPSKKHCRFWGWALSPGRRDVSHSIHRPSVHSSGPPCDSDRAWAWGQQAQVVEDVSLLYLLRPPVREELGDHLSEG